MTDHHRRQRSNDTRVPPHNLDAERSLLGAALLDARAVETVAGISPADFYAPQHQHIARAIGGLVDDAAPVDAVTVAEMLRRAGLLDEVGGAELLGELQNAVPAISAAGHYAKIVRDTARLRQLLTAAADISALVYAGDNDPGEAISRAGALVDNLAGDTIEDLSTVQIANIAALLETDLQPEQPQILARSDGGCLFYPGKLHTLQAEPTAGKSWVALAACAEVLAIGGSAVYIDYEDTDPGLLGRMISLGADPAALRDRFEIIRYETYGTAERITIGRVIERLNPDLVIIDGVAEALIRDGLDEDSAGDVTRWADSLPRPLARAGSAVVMLDHVIKSTEDRGRWARGSGAKLAIVDGATYQVKVRHAWSRKRAGRADLVIAKDRPGGIGGMGETAAEVYVEPHADGARVVIRFEPHLVDVDQSDTWKPTILMGRIMTELAQSTLPLSASRLLDLVHGQAARKKEALARLQAEGYIVTASGRARTLSIVKPWDGATSPNGDRAPAWRQPPPELDLEHHDDAPLPDELDELARQRSKHFYDHPDY